jgi:DNA polymerase III epsilon subunit family exonuclease
MKLAFADTETTGLEPSSRVIEAAVIITDVAGNVIDTYETLINPEMPIPPCATSANGITDAMVSQAPLVDVAMAEFWSHIPEDAVLVAHYAQFDVGMLHYASQRAGLAIDIARPVIDTCAIAKAVKATKANNLDALVEHYGIVRKGDAHRAMCDALAMMDYYWQVNDKNTIGNFAKPWAEAGASYRYIVPEHLPVELSMLPDLVRGAGRMEIEYSDAQDKITTREITPHGWYGKGEHLYLTGWCHLRNDQRSFRADRIANVSKAA